MIWYDEGVYYESVRRGGEEERRRGGEEERRRGRRYLNW